MPIVITPRRRAAAPPVLSLNPLSSLSRGVVAILSPVGGREPIGGGALTFQNPSVISRTGGPLGAAFLFTPQTGGQSAQGMVLAPRVWNLADTASISFGAVFIPRSNSQSEGWIGSMTGTSPQWGLGLYADSSGAVYGGAIGNNGLVGASSGSASRLDRVTAGLVVATSTGAFDTWVDGTYLGSAGHNGSGGLGTANIEVTAGTITNNRFNNAQGFGGEVFLAVGWTRRLTAVEARAWANDPLQIIAPRRRFWMLPDAGGGSTITATSSLDAAVQRALSGTATMGAAIQAARTTTATADAGLSLARTATSTLDGALVAARTATASLAAAVQQALTAIATADAGISTARTATATTDAAVRAALTAAATADAAVQAARTSSATGDAAIVVQQALTASLAAAVLATRTVTATLDAQITGATSLTAQLEAAIRFSATATAALDAALSAARSNTATIDAALQLGRSSTATLEAALQAARTVAATLDGFILAGSQVSTTLTAAVRFAGAATATLEAALQTARTAIATADAAIALNRTATLTIGAAILHSMAATSTVDGAVRAAAVASSSVDAYILDSAAINPPGRRYTAVRRSGYVVGPRVRRTVH